MKDTNFFEPYIDKSEFNFKGKKLLFLAGAGIVIFSLVMFPVVNKIRIYRMNREIVKIDSEINSTQNKIKKENIEAKRQAISELKEKGESLSIITNDFYKKDNVGDFLVYSITESMTSGMFLKSMEISGDEAIVVGISQEKESIAKLERNLRRIVYFKEVFIPNITLEEDFYQFTVNMKINSEEVNIKKEEQLEEKIEVEGPQEDGGEVEVEAKAE